ncbi:MAG: hypothetical protein GY716_12740, partial [bacterium]|nr:hypothetical protein [bacterium]
FRLQGELFGDPDFDLLRITAGTDFGLPSPGHTTLTQVPGGSFNVDSFFDITYQIEFVGAPGSQLDGESGTTTGTLRMQTGDGGPCTNTPVDCDDGDPCTLDSCDPETGVCVHEPGPVPLPVVGLAFHTKAVFEWPASLNATHWNSYRGSLGATQLYNHVCFESGDARGDGETTSTDPSIPSSGGVFYYLTSGENACGESDLGHASSGAVRPNSSPCPTPP